MIPLDLSTTYRLAPPSSDEKALASPLKASQCHSSWDHTTTESSSSVATLSPLHTTRKSSRRHSAETSWSVVRSQRVRRRSTAQQLRRHCAVVEQTVPDDTVPTVPAQLVECADDTQTARRSSASSSSAAAASASVSRLHSTERLSPPRSPSTISPPPPPPAHPAAVATAATLPQDPRAWSRDDVHAWLREMSLRYNMATIDTNRFLMNGKALCLMNPNMFLYRVPRDGGRLHRDFQSRLFRAINAAAVPVQ